MKTMQLNDTVPGPVLIQRNAEPPNPGPFEVLIRVHAAGVTPTELNWYPTLHRKTGEKRSGAIPGHEFSGVVVAVGENVGSLEIGRKVFGLNDWFADGAIAEYCISEFSSVAPKPAHLTHIEAAAVPIGALTAWQGLFDRANLMPGERVLVHGAAGAVGVFAVQLAQFRGARVIATASTRNVEFVSSLGAHQVIDYHSSRFEDSVKDVDVVFDAVGGETLDRSWNVLKPGGRLVTIAVGGESTTDDRVKKAFFIVEPNQKQLSIIADLLDTGKLQAIVDTVVPLERAADAYMGTLPRHGCGKLVVSVATEEQN